MHMADARARGQQRDLDAPLPTAATIYLPIVLHCLCILHPPLQKHALASKQGRLVGEERSLNPRYTVPSNFVDGSQRVPSLNLKLLRIHSPQQIFAYCINDAFAAVARNLSQVSRRICYWMCLQSEFLLLPSPRACQAKCVHPVTRTPSTQQTMNAKLFIRQTSSAAPGFARHHP